MPTQHHIFVSGTTRLNVLVVACDRIGYDFAPAVGHQEISSILSADDISHRIDLSREDLTQFEPDFIFTSSPYDMYIKPEFSSDRLSRIGKLVHFSYGAVLIEWEGTYQFLADNPYLQNTYAFLLNLHICLRAMTSFNLSDISNLTVIFLWTESDEISSPSVAWKPRWTGDSDSTLGTYAEYFLKLSQENEIILNVVVHPMLLASLSKNSESDRIRQVLVDLQNQENVNFVSGPDFLDDVLGSDILVGDISSTLAEYTWTGNPIICTATSLKLNELGRRVIEKCHVARDADELNQQLTQLLNGVDPKGNHRVGLFSEVFVTDAFDSTARRLINYLIQDQAQSRDEGSRE